MNVVITGCAGSGGSYLCEYILEHHPDVKVHGLHRWHSTTSQRNLAAVKDRMTLHECDMTDLPSLIRVLRAVRPERIFNLASHANVRVCFDTPVAVLTNNVLLMANLLEAVRLECPETILHHCSTSEVYGTPKSSPIAEDHPLNPVNPYAVSKLAQEALCLAYHRSWDLHVVVTRAFAYVNPRRRELFATAFARQIVAEEARQRKIGWLDGGTIRHGNLESIRTLIDVRDMAEAYWIACEKCQCGVPYNIGGLEPVSVGNVLWQLMHKSTARTNTGLTGELDHNLLRPVDVTNQVPDCRRFADATGWKPKRTLDESLEFLLDHCRREQQ